MDFPPILALLFIWLLIGLPLSKLSKIAKKQQQEVRNAKPAATPKQQNAKPKQQQQQTPKPAAPRYEGSPIRPTVMQPTITVTEHDDSVYQGSMNADTGEGYDPCHDEQLAPLTLAETAVPAGETGESGLQLGWTGSDIVRGFVMSEILKRKTR